LRAEVSSSSGLPKSGLAPTFYFVTTFHCSSAPGGASLTGEPTLMNATELKAFIRQISKEKDLDVEVVKEAIQQAIISASKKNLSKFVDARLELDVDPVELHLYVTKTVVKIATNPRTQISQRDAQKIKADAEVGDQIEVEIDPAIFGRIAAQS